MSPRAKTPKTWPHLEALIVSGRQVTLGEVGPISCAARVQSARS